MNNTLEEEMNFIKGCGYLAAGVVLTWEMLGSYSALFVYYEVVATHVGR